MRKPAICTSAASPAMITLSTSAVSSAERSCPEASASMARVRMGSGMGAWRIGMAAVAALLGLAPAATGAWQPGRPISGTAHPDASCLEAQAGGAGAAAGLSGKTIDAADLAAPSPRRRALVRGEAGCPVIAADGAVLVFAASARGGARLVAMDVRRHRQTELTRGWGVGETTS